MRRKIILILKIVFPIIAFALLMTLVFWPRDKGLDEDMQKALIEPEEGLHNLKYTGRDSKDEKFEVKAQKAINLANKKIALTLPEAEFNSGFYYMKSGKGIYNQELQTLELQNGIKLFGLDGNSFYIPNAFINLSLGEVQSDDKTHAEGSFGKIISDGIKIQEKGDRVYFKGKTKIIFTPQEKDKANE